MVAPGWASLDKVPFMMHGNGGGAIASRIAGGMENPAAALAPSCSAVPALLEARVREDYTRRIIAQTMGAQAMGQSLGGTVGSAVSEELEGREAGIPPRSQQEQQVDIEEGEAGGDCTDGTAASGGGGDSGEDDWAVGRRRRRSQLSDQKHSKSSVFLTDVPGGGEDSAEEEEEGQVRFLLVYYKGHWVSSHHAFSGAIFLRVSFHGRLYTSASPPFSTMVPPHSPLLPSPFLPLPYVAAQHAPASSHIPPLLPPSFAMLGCRNPRLRSHD